MNAYLNGIPEPLYALFGTGYLGYTVAREWGKAKASAIPSCRAPRRGEHGQDRITGTHGSVIDPIDCCGTSALTSAPVTTPTIMNVTIAQRQATTV